MGCSDEFEIFENNSLKLGNSNFKKKKKKETSPPTEFEFGEDHWEENSALVWKLSAAIL